MSDQQVQNEQTIKTINGVRYYNMTQCASYLGMSLAGWRKRRDNLIKQQKLVVYHFGTDTHAIYAREEDLERLIAPNPIRNLDELYKREGRPEYINK